MGPQSLQLDLSFTKLQNYGASIDFIESTFIFELVVIDFYKSIENIKEKHPRVCFKHTYENNFSKI